MVEDRKKVLRDLMQQLDREGFDELTGAIRRSEPTYELFVSAISHESETRLMARLSRAIGVAGIGLSVIIAAASYYLDRLNELNSKSQENKYSEISGVVERNKKSMEQQLDIKINDFRKLLPDLIEGELETIRTRIRALEDTSLLSLSSNIVVSENEKNTNNPIVRNQDLSIIREFSGIVDIINRGNSFSSSDRDRAMRLVRAIKTTDAYKSSPAFFADLEVLIDAFAGAGSFGQIAEIDELYRDEMLKESGIGITLIQVFGKLLIGADGAPENWSDVERDRLNAYLKANQSNLPGLVHITQMLMTFVQEGQVRSPAVDAILAEFEGVASTDGSARRTGAQMLRSYRDLSELVHNPDNAEPYLQKLVERTRKFIDVYGPELQALDLI